MASLDGANTWFDRTASAGFVPGTDSWTLYAWVLPAADTTDTHMIVSWYRCGANPGCTNQDTAGYQLYLDTSGHAYFWMRDDQAHEILLLNGTRLTSGGWHQLVGTYDAVTQLAKFYVDAALVSGMTTTMGSVTPGPVSVPLTVGRAFRQGWAQPTYYFHGGVDDVRLYRRALGAAEITTLFHAGTVDATPMAEGIALGNASPNPARALSSVRATIPAPAHVALGVYDALGRRVRRLFDGPRNAGAFTVSWDGMSEEGARAPSGVYFYRLETVGQDGAFTRTTRVALVR